MCFFFYYLIWKIFCVKGIFFRPAIIVISHKYRTLCCKCLFLCLTNGITCPSLLWVQIPPGTLNYFMWGSYPAIHNWMLESHQMTLKVSVWQNWLMVCMSFLNLKFVFLFSLHSSYDVKSHFNNGRTKQAYSRFQQNYFPVLQIKFSIHTYFIFLCTVLIFEYFSYMYFISVIYIYYLYIFLFHLTSHGYYIPTLTLNV